MTKRVLLGVTNGFGDFLGMASPFTIKFKVMMRQLFLVDDPLTWDDEVPLECRSDWISLIVEALEALLCLFQGVQNQPMLFLVLDLQWWVSVILGSLHTRLGYT